MHVRACYLAVYYYHLTFEAGCALAGLKSYVADPYGSRSFFQLRKLRTPLPWNLESAAPQYLNLSLSLFLLAFIYRQIINANKILSNSFIKVINQDNNSPPLSNYYSPEAIIFSSHQTFTS